MLFFLYLWLNLLDRKKKHNNNTAALLFFVSSLHLTLQLQCVLLHYLLFVNVEVEWWLQIVCKSINKTELTQIWLYWIVWCNSFAGELRIFSTTAGTTKSTLIHSSPFSLALLSEWYAVWIQGSSFMYFSIFHTNVHMPQFN